MAQVYLSFLFSLLTLLSYSSLSLSLSSLALSFLSLSLAPPPNNLPWSTSITQISVCSSDIVWDGLLKAIKPTTTLAETPKTGKEDPLSKKKEYQTWIEGSFFMTLRHLELFFLEWNSYGSTFNGVVPMNRIEGDIKMRLLKGGSSQLQRQLPLLLSFLEEHRFLFPMPPTVDTPAVKQVLIKPLQYKRGNFLHSWLQHTTTTTTTTPVKDDKTEEVKSYSVWTIPGWAIGYLASQFLLSDTSGIHWKVAWLSGPWQIVMRNDGGAEVIKLQTIERTVIHPGSGVELKLFTFVIQCNKEASTSLADVIDRLDTILFTFLQTEGLLKSSLK